ncbi:hypothetical protein [Pseudanabaena sp. PCC 6802]|uniref:hypothetical protein n=1 Tax=Pseudanabaena sp. PCC 6802 TaxID=118173 RepID=UPI00034C8E2F|nr:hypothetical protein [Pseudanabaena sp. PCC 6802]
MANISIPNLSPAGSDLFVDSESYMNDVSDRDLGHVAGGGSAIPPDTIPPVTLTTGDYNSTAIIE